jgi:hypothetical protein
MTPFPKEAPPFSLLFLRLVPGTTFGAILVDFGSIWESFCVGFGVDFRRFSVATSLRKSCKNLAQKLADTLGNPTRTHKS